MDAYLGELRVFAAGMIPFGWASCNGQSLPIDDNKQLFSLLGTTYGGDGKTTFNLPDLRGRAMLHFGHPPYAPQTAFSQGQAAGTETVTLDMNNLPAHSHSFRAASSQGTETLFVSNTNYLAQPVVPQITGENIAAFTPNVSAGSTLLHNNSIAPTGDTQPHKNCMPYLTMLVCIAVIGEFPSGQ